MTAKRYTDGVKKSGWTPFPGRFWQRNYWEHIVRNETQLNRIRQTFMTIPSNGNGINYIRVEAENSSLPRKPANLLPIMVMRPGWYNQPMMLIRS
jgi:hypothetical protein